MEEGQLRRDPLWQRLLLVALLVVAFGLRSHGLGDRSLMYDEGWSWHYSSGSLRGILDATSSIDLPPGYFLLLHAWMKVTGETEFAMRFLMVLPAVVLVALLFAIARRLFGMVPGLLAAALVAVQPVQVFYAHSLRMYPLATLLVLAAAYLAYLAVRRGGLRYWLGYAVAGSLALYTHYHSGFSLATLSLVFLAWWLIRSRSRGTLARWLASQLAVALAFVPWLPFVVRYVGEPGAPPWRRFVGLGDVLLESWWGWMLLPGSTPREVPLLWLAAVALLLLWALGATAAAYRGRWALTVGVMVLSLLVLYAASYLEPVFHPRYVVLLAPGAVLLLALGLWRLGRVHVLVMTAALLGLAGVWGYVLWRYHQGAFANDDYRSLAQYLALRVRPGDALLVHAGYAYPPFLYYYPGRVAWRGRLVDYAPALGDDVKGLVLLQGGSLVGGFTSRSDDYYTLTEEELQRVLDEVLRAHPRLWMLRVYNTVVDPQERTEAWLSQRARLVEQVTFDGTSFMQLRRYASRLAPAPEGASGPRPLFGGQITLLSSDYFVSRVGGRDVARLSLYWRAERPLERDYHYFVHLRDTKGRLVAQADGPPLEGRYPTSEWEVGEVIRDDIDVFLPALRQPLLIRAEVGWYDPATLDRLPLAPDGSSVELGRLRTSRSSAVPGQGAALADFDGKLALRGYNLEPPLPVAGGSLRVVLAWEALERVPEDYTVFVHLVDAEGDIVAQSDHQPGGGLLPTSYWLPAEVFSDEHRLRIPATVAPGRYGLLVGLYELESGRRLLLTEGGADSWRLGEVLVR